MTFSYFTQTYFLIYSEVALTFCRLQGQRVAEQTQYPLTETTVLSSVLAKIKEDYSLKSEDTLVVGLPLRLFNIVSFRLPLAAEENIDEAIGYELARHVPYGLDACRYDYTFLKQGDGLVVRAIFALREPLQEYLAVLTASGLPVSAVTPGLVLVAWLNQKDGVYLHSSGTSFESLLSRGGEVVFTTTSEFTGKDEKPDLGLTLSLLQNHGFESGLVMLWGDSVDAAEMMADLPEPLQKADVKIAEKSIVPPLKGLPYKIELVSEQSRRKKRFKLQLQVAAWAIFILSLGCYPLAYLAGKNSALGSLQEQLEVVREKAQNLDVLRQQNKAMIDRYENLAKFVRSQPQAIDILKEVADVISPETWLDALELHNRKLVLRGTSTAATSVIEALVSSPLLEDVHFDSPVVKKGSQETFTIVANLK